MTADAADLPHAPPAGGQGRRYLVVLGVVLVWMLGGTLLQLPGNAYLIAGVPLLLVFQLFVARRPLTEIWFRKPQGSPLPAWGWIAAAAFMAFPAYSLASEWGSSPWDVRLWYAASAGGAVPLAHSLARFNRTSVRPLAVCFATAGALGILFVALPTYLAHHSAAVAGLAGTSHTPSAGFRPRFAEFLRSLLLYVPVVFVLEEVFFRGGLDSYLHREGDDNPWLSAAFVSALWGFWHLPFLIPGLRHSASPVAAALFLAIPLMSIHCLVGIPLSFAWRKGGLLFLPAVVHAFVDAVRNALQLH